MHDAHQCMKKRRTWKLVTKIVLSSSSMAAAHAAAVPQFTRHDDERKRSSKQHFVISDKHGDGTRHYYIEDEARYPSIDVARMKAEAEKSRQLLQRCQHIPVDRNSAINCAAKVHARVAQLSRLLEHAKSVSPELKSYLRSSVQLIARKYDSEHLRGLENCEEALEEIEKCLRRILETAPPIPRRARVFSDHKSR